jgi:hypothetical protein
MHRTQAAALILTALAASAGIARAQNAAAPRAFTFGASGGLSLPMGDFADGVKSGFNAGAHLAFKPAMLPFGVRVEAQYNRFGVKGLGLDDFGSDSVDFGGDFGEDFGDLFPFDLDLDGNARIVSGTVNAVFGVPAASGAFRPYLIGGVGVYNEKVSFTIFGLTASRSQTKLGINGGAGIEFGLGRLAAFAEARYHMVFDKEDDEEIGGIGNIGGIGDLGGSAFNTTYIPISIGIRF